MILTVRLLGNGTRQDMYRAALPTYTLILANYDAATAIVSIPEEVHGLTDKDLEHETRDLTSEGTLYHTLCGDCLQKAHDYIDKRYPEHKGEFRIEPVPVASK